MPSGISKCRFVKVRISILTIKIIFGQLKLLKADHGGRQVQM
jgi:hypothetical protein